MRNFAQISKGLHALTKKGVAFDWTEDHENVLETIKEGLLAAPVSTDPDFDKPSILDTEASGTAIAVVLSQQNKNSVARIVACANRSPSKEETRRAMNRREMIAVVWACLELHKFRLRSNHCALKWIFFSHSTWASSSVVRSLGVIYICSRTPCWKEPWQCRWSDL